VPAVVWLEIHLYSQGTGRTSHECSWSCLEMALQQLVQLQLRLRRNHAQYEQPTLDVFPPSLTSIWSVAN
jgi:hypothetical protein